LRDIAPDELQDAFMQETVARVAAAEKIVEYGRAGLGAAAGGTPAGLVFHVARCGSTLIAQMLKRHGGAVVYAEPLPFNELLLPPHAWPRRELVAALRTLGGAFARHAGKPYVLKFTSWNTLFCDIVAEAFPAAPWILCLRDPVEVGVSLLARPPGWLGLVDAEAKQTGSPEEKVARVFGAFCDAAARLDPGRGRLVRYDALPAAAWEIVAPHFSLPVGDPERDRMGAIATVHAKAPLGQTIDFAGDAAAKQARASAALRQAVDGFARPKLEMLEKLHAEAPR
jgi:hypothetical protein